MHMRFWTQEPSSSRSYKRPRLDQGFSQPGKKMGTNFFDIPREALRSAHNNFTSASSLRTTLIIPSSSYLPSRDEILHEQHLVEPLESILFGSPKRIQNQTYDRVIPLSSTSFSTVEELPMPSTPFHEPPKRNHAPLASIARSSSDTQLSSDDGRDCEEVEAMLLKDVGNGHDSSFQVARPQSSTTQSMGTSESRNTQELIENFLVERVDNIHLLSGHSSLQSSQITGSSLSRRSTDQPNGTPRGGRLYPHSKPHIHHRRFKADVRKRTQQEIKLQLQRRHWQLIKHSSEARPMNLADYTQLLQNLAVERPHSFPRLKSRAYHESGMSLKRTLDNAKATLNSPKPPLPFSPSDEQRKLCNQKKDADIESRLRGFPEHLPKIEDDEVTAILRKRGVVAKFAREQVADVDISRLNPGQWLNDEVINFYGAMILARSEGNKENAQIGGKGGNGLLNVHYFSTFFWAKLIKEGYEQGRLAKWTKKIDIFSKDVVLIPINHSNAHWTAAAINFRKKRIESYDTMGMAKRVVFDHLRVYLEAEHRDKKKKPFDFTGWEDIAPEDIPRQENGWDCGVFTSQFLEALSRGVEKFAFVQQNMPYLRRRMIWEIGNGMLRKDYK